jgi:type II secretory ATPase GspE/PulE/Tfp pilus assembly ATPase PilB-like protein
MQSLSSLQARLSDLGAAKPESASRVVDIILGEAVARSASDVHFEPGYRAVEVRFRIDGVLQSVAELDRELAPNLIARLKVMAELLTYRLDIPQEGSIRLEQYCPGKEMRVSTFPTIHGEKAVVRLFHVGGQILELEQLGLPTPLLEQLMAFLRERTGAIFLTGPSGSGKTTTIYACLRYLLRLGGGGLHIVTIEDPVEQVIDGITQAQARPGSDFDFARGLRSLLRHDPEVIMIGEVRDRETAGIVVEAALTGHLVFSTLHAGSACGVISRLLDMGIEPYLLTSGLKGILNQRLVRRGCETCRQSPTCPRADCPSCSGSGYRGRVLLAEALTPDRELRQAILAKADLTELEEIARRLGRRTIWMAADEAVAAGWTSQDEIDRVLGPRC